MFSRIFFAHSSLLNLNHTVNFSRNHLHFKGVENSSALFNPLVSKITGCLTDLKLAFWVMITSFNQILLMEGTNLFVHVTFKKVHRCINAVNGYNENIRINLQLKSI